MRTGAGRRPRKTGWIADVLRNPFSYLLLLPAGLYTFIFGYLTLPYIVIAFQNYNYKLGLFRSPFVGLRNFEFFFKSNRAWQVTYNTVYLNVLFIITGTVAAVALALMLNEIRLRRYKKITQSVLIFPNFLSWIIVQYIVYAFLSTNYGWVNGILTSVGMPKLSLYSSADRWPLLLVIIRIWKGVGMSSVIYIAAITGMDEGLFESACIDGANKAQQIWHITLPLLMPTICILTLLSVGKIFYGDFQMIYALVGDNGIVLEKTDVIDTYVFRALRQTGDPAGAMAVGIYQALVGFIMVYGSNQLTKRYFPDGALF
ncbi:MAG: sugar ABC transporter permease [Clostridiales bacterium]|nr:sugar ABC transporter permease [Clostridiales bacterium]